MSCVHKWLVLTTTYQPPSFATMRTEGRMSDLILQELIKANERASVGATHYLLTCDVCGEIEERTLVGEPQKDKA